MNFLSMFTVPVIQTLSYYDDAVNTVTLFIELIALLIGCCGWGFVTKKVGENRGHYDCFWWGFWLGPIGLIVVLTKPNNITSYQRRPTYDTQTDREKLNQGYWKCSRCGKLNPPYYTSCDCGLDVKESQRMQQEKEAKESPETPRISLTEELVKFKSLFDDGALTEEEFQHVKNKLLSLPESAAPRKSLADELKKLKSLLDAGVINQEEFQAKKQSLLLF